MEEHNKAVAVIAANVRQFFDRKEAFRIYHGTTNSTRQLSFQRDKMIDTSRLTHVLKVDTKARTALVEPNVPMDCLVEATLKYGLVPPVVMEFPGIIVGGGFAGTAGESSSFKYGFFDRTVNWIEMVLANGNVVTASETENSDLFNGAAGSFGTLGVATLFELQLIEAKKYVEVTYSPVYNVPEAVRKIQEATKDPSIEYIDGILFSLDKGVIVTGRLTDLVQPNSRIQRFSRARDPWFYLHAKQLPTQTAGLITEAIPLTDYLFRYDRGAFWTGAYAFKYFVTPFNRITRWMLDFFLHTRVMYHALHASGLSKQYIVQDLALPYSTVEQFIEYVDQAFGIYPLWLCPLKQSQPLSLHPHVSSVTADENVSPQTTLLNVGVWGAGPTSHSEFVLANRKLEQKVRELSGMKWLYAHTYYTEEEFWEIYDRKWYDSLRSKYEAGYLPNVYDKVKVDVAPKRNEVSGWGILWLLSLLWGVWPFSGFWGILQATKGGDYLLAK